MAVFKQHCSSISCYSGPCLIKVINFNWFFNFMFYVSINFKVICFEFCGDLCWRGSDSRWTETNHFWQKHKTRQFKTVKAGPKKKLFVPKKRLRTNQNSELQSLEESFPETDLNRIIFSDEFLLKDDFLLWKEEVSLPETIWSSLATTWVQMTHTGKCAPFRGWTPDPCLRPWARYHLLQW